MPIFIAPGVSELVADGETLELDYRNTRLTNVTTGVNVRQRQNIDAIDAQAGHLSSEGSDEVGGRVGGAEMDGFAARNQPEGQRCGDGRFVIAAAKTYGAHGVGIDITPERIAEAKANAKKILSRAVPAGIV